MLRASATDALESALQLIADPALPDVLERLKVLHELEAASPNAPTAPVTGQPKLGVGLRYAVPVLDGVIFVRRNPWVAFAAAAAFVFLIGDIGYRLGKRASK